MKLIPVSVVSRLLLVLLLLPLFASFPLRSREKDTLQYGQGLIVNVPLPVSQVAEVVRDVVQNGIIRGTKEYNRDEYITGAMAASSSNAFPAWTEEGKVFYKVRKQALDPRNFKDSGDVGTLTVRYVVQPQGDKNTVLRIDAVFVEDFRHTSHPSNGSVESSEYKDIHDHLDAIELMKKQTAEVEKERQQEWAKKQRPDAGLSIEDSSSVTPQPAPEAISHLPATAPDSKPQPAVESLEQHVQNLRRQLEWLVKAPGAPLKSAPFHTASTLKSMPSGTEVLILISTPYWYGVETHEGQHGWIIRDQLEQLP